MPEMKYERDLNRLDCNGLDLNRPVDSVKPGKFPFLKNVRAYQAGRIEPRFGLTLIDDIVSGQTPVHSVRRLNDPLNSTYTRVVGAGTHLAYGQGSFTDIDSGYSGDPLALQPWNPAESPTPFMYVADRSRMRKISASGSLHTIGLAAPEAPPTVGPDTILPSAKEVTSLQSTAGWGQGGTAAAPSLQTRVNTTITYILFDSGSTGACCIGPASAANIGDGCELVLDSGGANAETVVVQSVYSGSASTTISAITYDSGTSGLCSLVLTIPVNQAACDVLIRNSTVGPENARIVAVTVGLDGTTSIRIVTTGTWAAGNTVQLIPTIRLVGGQLTHVVGETITRSAVRFAVTSGTGTITLTTAVDLSVLFTGTPVSPEDYMHISLKVSDPTVVTELRILLDVDPATNDFTRNYYWVAFRPSDLTSANAALQSLLATRQQLIQRNVVNQPAQPSDQNNYEDTQEFRFLVAQVGEEQARTIANARNTQTQQDQQVDLQLQQLDNAISQQMESGVSQWVELMVPISQLLRVGTDTARTLQNVAKIQIMAIVTGNVDVDADSWLVSGGFGPDTYATNTVPYFYRYRARNVLTNVASNFSPASRYAATPIRQSVKVQPTQYAAPSGTTLSTSDFVLDIERFGGLLTDWHYVGTTTNSATPSFVDEIADTVIAGNPIIDNSNYQPWPVIGASISGTATAVVGTTVTDSGTTFNVSWAPGTRIVISGLPYTIYRVRSTSKLELVENAGVQASVSWRIDAPTILAQPLPCLWVQNNTLFACGDPLNPGRLYYSNPGSETTTTRNWTDATSPSEPLANGLAYNVRSYVFSSENMYQILQTQLETRVGYTAQIIPNGKGLFSRWAMTREPAPIIAFLSKDGIYLSDGGAPVSLTDDDLLPLFPSEGNLGSAVNGIPPPNIILAQATKLRLAYYDEYLYFDYPRISGGGYSTLALTLFGDKTAPSGWLYDEYTPAINCHYGEEGPGVHSLLCGGTNANLYQYAGDSDNGAAIECVIQTPSRDQGDPRLNKLYGDIMLDADTAGVDVTATPQFNNQATSATPVTVNTSSRILTTIPFGSAWETARNISLLLEFDSSSSEKPLFYIWEPRWTFEAAPIAALSWEISPSTLGMENFKTVGICKITHVSTVDMWLIFTVDGVVQPTIVIPNSGGVYVQTVFRVPVMKGKLYKMRLAASDGVTDVRIDPRDSFIEVKDWGHDSGYTPMRVFGDYSLIEG